MFSTKEKFIKNTFVLLTKLFVCLENLSQCDAGL